MEYASRIRMLGGKTGRKCLPSGPVRLASIQAAQAAASFIPEHLIRNDKHLIHTI
jgi:hypothetical protein